MEFYYGIIKNLLYRKYLCISIVISKIIILFIYLIIIFVIFLGIIIVFYLIFNGDISLIEVF